jgi:hypothetical protein
MEISTLMLIVILVVAVLFSFLCGILIERRSSRNPMINSRPKNGSNIRVVEPEFIVTNAEYSGIDDFCTQIVKNTAKNSYFDNSDKMHTMSVTFYTTGSKYSIGDRLVFVTRKELDDLRFIRDSKNGKQS